MSAPDDHPGMEIDLLKGSSRTLLNRVLLAQETWIAIAILVLGLVVSMIAPKFATPGNLLNIFQNACFIGIMAIGMTPVIISGGIDISVGSILGMCGVTLGIVLNADMPLVVGIVATLAMGVLCGAVNGTIIAYVKLPPFIVTLATLSIGRSLALVLTNNQVFYEFGRASDAIVALGGGYTLGLPNVVYALVIGVIVLHFLLTMSRWGRYLFAIGGNEPAARLSGIPVDLIKISAYAFSGFMVAVTAIFLVGWLGAVTNSIGTGYELQVIASTVIGGASLTGGFGSALGAGIGAILVETIRNALLLAGVNPFWQGTFVGCFILAAVLLERIRSVRR
ncbi:ABC transporter permease (plasmid) [Mesorhizobium loti]|uniref:ABC transporter permease n=2 Tax=Mesorhizobium jarvisii TaxID=1777867 RepID=A0A6M7TRD7_9HYPH|nr:MULTISPECIES: ABC transporter permease [Mesorhizobium]QKC67499.1 ABC transporter permease [Mesorhizobium jarvisii]QKD13413.1 ABC transporter permease [Mesorhizobium loti]RJT29523.1 ABC transporter permease [Mesorhizobium jarvisii]